MKAILSAALLLSSSAEAARVTVAPQYAANLQRTDAQAASSAASFLARAQSDLAAQRGGPVLRASWAFEQKSPLAAPNAAGIVARALVTAHQRFQHDASLAAARAWGLARLEDLAADRPMFDPDVEALVALADATGDARFRKAATAAFELRHGGADGREVVERLFLVRGDSASLVGFDAAAAVRAALAVGQAGKAREIVQALADTRERWDRATPHGFHHTSRAAVLEVALRTGHDRLASALAARLLATQERDGSWGARNTQATAYAARALGRVNVDGAREASARAARFLRLTQLTSGGWATYNDFLPEPFVGDTVYEVSAEALLAIAELRG
ncbi:MAG: hypothetical protein ACK4N5_09870 [Myxococcales bacterium]